jgi:cation diffusion facilitator family transporter
MSDDAATRLGAVSLVSNISFAAIKLLVGVIGNSFALIADGIESLADVLSSVIVWSGLKVSGKEADHEHPYGRELANPGNVPAAYTVPVLIVIILAKHWLYLILIKKGKQLDSLALKAEAWHHLSDSLTSLGVLVGLILAVFAGPGFGIADDVAALLVTLLIVINAIRLIRPALDELMDRRIEDHGIEIIEQIASKINGIEQLETITIRRSGRGFVAEIHLEVDPYLTVEKSHHLSHLLKDQLLADKELRLTHAVMHVEPFEAKS